MAVNYVSLSRQCGNRGEIPRCYMQPQSLGRHSQQDLVVMRCMVVLTETSHTRNYKPRECELFLLPDTAQALTAQSYLPDLRIKKLCCSY